ncbi:MAG: hypothetical protein Q7T18_05395, partial [Sedimentisphaerales bacterium]|nr:hypothetical protein [Sedimentisphaerales bacterium]
HWEQRWAYLERGLYWQQLEPYVQQFGSDRLMVRLFEQSVKEDPMKFLIEFFSRVGVTAPANTSFQSVVHKGGKEFPELAQVAESQKRAGVTNNDLAAWLAYMPSGEELTALTAYFASDVERIKEYFSLDVGKYWRNFA